MGGLVWVIPQLLWRLLAAKGSLRALHWTVTDEDLPGPQQLQNIVFQCEKAFKQCVDLALG
jgi:hypothetical protein